MFTSRRLWLRACLSAGSLSLLAIPAVAQTLNIVTLESYDKTVSLSGELVGATNGQYQINTISGILSIDINDVSCAGDGCPPVEPDFVVGAEARLTSSDGTMNVTGKLMDIVDDQYVLDNAALGSIRVDIQMVDCSGEGCPSGLRFAEKSATASIATPPNEPEAISEDAVELVEPEVISENAAEVVAPELFLENTAEPAESEVIPKNASELANPANASVSFAGSDTVGLGLLPFLLEDYADSLDASAITTVISETETLVNYVDSNESELSSAYVNATGSGDATDALEAKTAVFGMTSRPMNDDEASRLIATGTSDLRFSDYETVIAVDSLAVVANPANPIRELSIEELGAIYLGIIDNWSQVGGLDAPITVLSRDDGSSTRSVFENVVFAGQELPLAQSVTYPGGDNPEMAAAVKADPHAIGYVGFAYSEGLTRLDLTSECGITSTATSFAVKTEEYPLGRRLYLYNRPDNTPEPAQRFLEYVLSPEADDAIAQSNFVNFAVERTEQGTARTNSLYDGLDLQSAVQLRLANQMRVDLSLWDRLSTTIRFNTASSRLGNKELNDIDRLVSSLSESPLSTRLMVVGFADDVGAFENNLLLSQRRSETVADVIRSVASDRAPNVQIDTRSFSELSPSVCNTDANGRAINRRVEIWIRN